MHRRVVGVFKSEPGQDVGTFDFYWRHNRHVKERKAVCTVRRGVGWECLTIVIKENRCKNRSDVLIERAPLHSELQKLLPLFFHPHERPIQIHSGMVERCRDGLDFYWSERVHDTILHLPEFEKNFTLIKNNS
jgi:hypothetical protein